MAEGGYWCDETDQECGSGYTQNAHVQWEHASIETCTVMNVLGYGSHIRQARRDAYREWDRHYSAIGKGTIITTGSKAEGLTRYTESDRDILIVPKGVICLENDVNYDTLSKETTVFTLNTDMCYHGHCILFIADRPDAVIHPSVHSALCTGPNGRAVLSSDLYVNALKEVINKRDGVPLERAGPSISRTINGIFHTDLVMSFACYCPSILNKFAERRRHWPPPDVVHKVVYMGAFVTPVGYKGSENKHVEWRICFNTGENELVSSLNNTQVYIYVLLKMVVNDVLKPLKKEVSSYTVKNVVFWLSENNPQDFFNERTLLYWLREGLKVLRSAILTEHLSYYMIPERNLMASCGLDEKQKRAWEQMITDMIEEGPKVLFRLPKIRRAIISHPEPLLWYSKKRMEIELLSLKDIIGMCQFRDYRSDTILQALNIRKGELFKEIMRRMHLEGSRVDKSSRCVNLLFRIM